LRIIIAGGGTGGHIFPGIAVAKRFMELDKENKVLYVGAKIGMEGRIVPKYGIDLKLLSLGGIKGKSLVKKIVNLLKLPLGVIGSLRIIEDFKPQIVFGVGGYASYPALFSAKLLEIKTAVLEQNTVAGLANRVLGLFVDKVYLAFDYSAKFFPKEKSVVTGNPLRKEFMETAGNRNFDGEPFTVFVIGGSQGASNINKKVIQSLEHLVDIKENIKFVHQTGEKDFESVKNEYEKMGFNADIFSFRDDIAEILKNAHLVISRSGSGICEILAAGKPSVLVPYPFSSYDHQEINAKILVDGGAAIKIDDSDLNGELLAVTIKDFSINREKLREMGKKAMSLAKLDAAEKIVDDLISLAREAH